MPTFSARRRAQLVRTFDRSAALYERGRPGYPATAVRYLGRRLRLGPRSTVVEVGSGTGKFTRALRPLGAAIVAVEPMAGMRREFRRHLPDTALVEGTAERIPVPDGFADAVVAAQAFHWFAGPATLREFARILRPGGGLALVWNSRDETVPWVRHFTEIIERHGGRRGYHDGDWRRPFRRASSPFTPLVRRTFPSAQWLTPEEMGARALSVSIIAALPVAGRRQVEEAVAELLATDPATRGRPRIRLPYVTEVFTSRRRYSARASHPSRQRHPRHLAALGEARPS